MSQLDPAGIFDRHARLLESTREECFEAIVATGRLLVETIRSGGIVFVCGNGGSAADAQHFAAELTGQFFHKRRRGLPAVALTTDSSALTSIANDLGYHNVFARQVEALGRTGDVLVGITTSGRSGNVLAAFDVAYARGLGCVALVGADASAVAPYCSRPIAIPSRETARIQEMHILVIHTWCAMIDEAFAPPPDEEGLPR